MVSLLVESTCNVITTERNLELNSNIKKLIQVSINDQILNLHRSINVKDNRFFKEKNTDLLHTVSNSANSIEVLENNGYERTTIDEYDYKAYNECESMDTIGYKRLDKPDFINQLTLNYKGKAGDFSFFLDENFIIFFNVGNNSDKYYYKINETYKIKDFKVDKNMFAHFLYSQNGENYYIKTSLYLPFAELNSDNVFFNEDSILEKIKICGDAELIFSRNMNEINFFSKNMDITTSQLMKKYYFEENGVIYFNHSDLYEKVKDSLLSEFIQINNLNMYSYLSLLGLNDFKTVEGRKVSSIDGVFNNIFKNRFNNTLNGGINYFNAKNIKNDSDYSVNIKDDFFAINGNFVPDSLAKGNYKIKIFENTCVLYLCNRKGEEIVKKMKIKGNKFYMCNLKFEYLRYNKLDSPYILEVSNRDPYPFSLVTDSNVIFDKIYNNKAVSKKTLSNAKLKGFMNYNAEATFDGKKIIIKNFYDYSEKKFLFDNHYSSVSKNSKVKINEFYDFKTNVPYLEKEGYFYPRDKGFLTYTTMEEFEIALINENGFITNFWIENQGMEIYLKISENKILITEKKNECDYYFTVPFIKDFILNESKYTIIAIEDNNDYESEWDANSNSLITDRFMNNPLFSMWYIESSQNVDVYSVDKKIIDNIIKEPYNGGTIVYFDSLDETMYYNTEESKYNYFNPLKSFENITSSYKFNDNFEINFDKLRDVENFTLECDKTLSSEEEINLIMYNNKSGETFKLTINTSELGKPFTLGVSVDSMMIEKTETLKDCKFNFKITKINSIMKNGKITYIKGHIDNPVFQAVSKPSDMSFSSYNGIKVDTKYECMTNGEMKESYKGDLIIRHPFKSEIPVFKRNNFQYYYKSGSYCVVKEKDNFFSSNFRTPGLLTRTMGDVSNIKTHNSEFNIKEIIDNDFIELNKK